MPVTRTDELIARAFNDTQVVREFYMHGPATESEVIARIQTLPATVLGLPYATSEVEEEEEIQGDWRVKVTWGVPDKHPQQEQGTVEYKFNFQAPSQHIVQSLATVSRTPTGAGSPDFQGAINVIDDEGKQRVEGFDLAPPAETFTLSYAAQGGTITSGYQDTVANLVGTVNSTLYKSRWPAGSLFLTRVTGGLTGQNAWNIEFGFAYISNLTSIPVGNLVVAQKDGFDLLWAYYGPQKDANHKQLIKRPLAAYVERIYYRSNFANLALP